MLTIVVPTHNRPRHAAALLQLFRRCGLACPVVFADSGTAENAAQLRAACGDQAEIRRFPEDIQFADKVTAALGEVQTPYIAFLPDDDVALPYAIEACFAFLRTHEDFVAAQGYVLDFAMDGDSVDITRVRWFTPDVDQDDPLQRLYHLLRRYQPFFWSVYRREVLQEAVQASGQAPKLTILREITTMTSVVLRGKVARLPLVFSLRGTERSQWPLSEVDPFHAILADAPGFFAKYGQYRSQLVDRVQRALQGSAGRHAASREQLDHVVDLMHAIFVSHGIDGGMLNHAVRHLLGEPVTPLPQYPPQAAGPQPLASGDLVHEGAGRRYIWRQAVMEAEPRAEISVSAEEMQRVEEQLAHYRFTAAGAMPGNSPFPRRISSAVQMAGKLRGAMQRWFAR